jgi:hypothetical protein
MRSVKTGKGQWMMITMDGEVESSAHCSAVLYSRRTCQCCITVLLGARVVRLVINNVHLGDPLLS